jgi:hypothetical protein
VLAAATGAPPPRRLVWLGRFLAREQAVSLMTHVREASSAKAKRNSAGSRAPELA